MNKLTVLLLGGLSLASAVALSSCDKDAGFIGRWKSTTPTDITAEIPGASSANTKTAIDFVLGEHRDGGQVTLSSNVNITKLMQNDTLPDGKPIEVTVKATATVDGTWTYDVDDKDDLLLDLNLSGIKVNIPRSDVLFAPSYASMVPPQKLDSITSEVISKCTYEVSRAVSAEFGRYTVISDIEVAKDSRSMSFEVGRPETELHFVKEAL